MWAFIGDVLVLLGLLATIIVYRSQQVDTDNFQIDSTLAIFASLISGLNDWGDDHFASTDYGDARMVEARAKSDYQDVMAGIFHPNFHVPEEPIINLIQHSGTRGVVNRDTITTGNEMLRRIEIYNQFVRLQTEFFSRHCLEILDPSLDPDDREKLADAFSSISVLIHQEGVGDATWYHDFRKALNENVTDLSAHRRRYWWSRRSKTTRRK